MCFKIPFGDLDTAFKKQVREMCTIRMKPTEYEPTPPPIIVSGLTRKQKPYPSRLGFGTSFMKPRPTTILSTLKLK